MKAQALRGFYRQDGSSLQLSRVLCSTKFVLFKRLDFYYCLHLDLSFLHHPGPNHSMWVLFLWTSWMCTMDDAMMNFTPIFVICSHIQIMMMIVNAVRVKPRPESHLVKLGKHDSLLQMMLQWGKLRHKVSDPSPQRDGSEEVKSEKKLTLKHLMQQEHSVAIHCHGR